MVGVRHEWPHHEQRRGVCCDHHREGRGCVRSLHRSHHESCPEIGWSSQRWMRSLRLRDQTIVEWLYLQQGFVLVISASVTSCLCSFFAQPGGLFAQQSDIQHLMENLARGWHSCQQTRPASHCDRPGVFWALRYDLAFVQRQNCLQKRLRQRDGGLLHVCCH